MTSPEYLGLLAQALGNDENQRMQSDPWMMGARNLNQNPIQWNRNSTPGSMIGASIAQGLAGGLMGGFGQGQEKQQTANQWDTLASYLNAPDAAAKQDILDSNPSISGPFGKFLALSDLTDQASAAKQNQALNNEIIKSRLESWNKNGYQDTPIDRAVAAQLLPILNKGAGSLIAQPVSTRSTDITTGASPVSDNGGNVVEVGDSTGTENANPFAQAFPGQKKKEEGKTLAATEAAKLAEGKVLLESLDKLQGAASRFTDYSKPGTIGPALSNLTGNVITPEAVDQTLGAGVRYLKSFSRDYPEGEAKQWATMAAGPMTLLREGRNTKIAFNKNLDILNPAGKPETVQAYQNAIEEARKSFIQNEIDKEGNFVNWGYKGPTEPSVGPLLNNPPSSSPSPAAATQLVAQVDPNRVVKNPIDQNLIQQLAQHPALQRLPGESQSDFIKRLMGQ